MRLPGRGHKIPSVGRGGTFWVPVGQSRHGGFCMDGEHKDEGLWSTKQVTDYLKVDRETVYRWIKAGRLGCVKVGALNRYRPEDVRAIRQDGLPTGEAA